MDEVARKGIGEKIVTMLSVEVYEKGNRKTGYDAERVEVNDGFIRCLTVDEDGSRHWCGMEMKNVISITIEKEQESKE